MYFGVITIFKNDFQFNCSYFTILCAIEFVIKRLIISSIMQCLVGEIFGRILNF